MRLLTIRAEYFFLLVSYINQFESHPQTNFRQYPQREVPHRVDCTIKFRPGSNNTPLEDDDRDGNGDREGCECIPYYLCNSNKTMDESVGVLTGLTGVGLVSSPPYKPCPCSQATSSPKPNSTGACPNYLDVCCAPMTQVLSDEYPEQPPAWSDNLPPPWQNSPGRPPYWQKNSSDRLPPWNNKSPGNPPPWNNKIPGNPPPWNFKPEENQGTWNDDKVKNPTSWNSNSPGRPHSKQQKEGNFSSKNKKYPNCGRYSSIFNFQQDQGNVERHFPWMVAIFGERIVNGRSERNFFLCGGSLIRPDVVLTAAHCVKGKSSLVVRAGKWNSETEDGRESFQEKPVHHVRVHEEFYAGALYNDIALLFLEMSVAAGPSVGTVCLAESRTRVNLRDCFASGWGSKGFGENEDLGTALKKIELSIVPKEFCEESLQETRLGKYFQLHESCMCAKGKGGQDACTGDGGGPLVCPSLDQTDFFVQVGIVSWGIGCGGEIPSVYVNVSHFRPWIHLEMAALSVDEQF